MNQLYYSIGISKQAVHVMLNLRQKQRDESAQLARYIEDIRADHPTMGLRDMYYKIMPDFMGRDKFELFCQESGYSFKHKRNACKTTDSSGVKRFPNLIESLKIDRVNQVWQSDITYIEVGGRFYYLTFILDSYSRRIVGYSVSRRLLTEHTTLPALKMALKTRKGQDIKGLIFHSDGGGQYYAQEFLKTTQKAGIVNSMCKHAYENGKAERINGVIKNNYLRHWQIKSFEQLTQKVDHAVLMYNQQKPHIKLDRNSPIEFENKLLHLQSQRAMSTLESESNECFKSETIRNVKLLKMTTKQIKYSQNLMCKNIISK
ncbi:MAG: IS3 family transposase [Bacteroidales bacterium]|nr:IS3 family transposase [Bacteroidales bacterium]